MLALVTGSTGFLGSHLCRALLLDGHKVRAFHRSSSNLELLIGLGVDHVIGDVIQPETLTAAMQGVDVVFHAASKVDYWRGRAQMYEVTVGGTKNVLQTAQQAGVQRVVYTSSVAALGVPDLGLINENHPWNYNPKWWAYGHAKHLAEREIQTAVARGLDVVIVNPASIFGPGDINRVSGEILIQLKKLRLPFAIPGGMNVIDVRDVARGHLAAFQFGQTGQRYILGAHNISHLELFQTIAAVIGARPTQKVAPAWLLRALAGPVDLLQKVFPLPFNGEILRFAGRDFYYDTGKTENELSFTWAYSVHEMVQETYDWYHHRGDM